jgi:hypothetical protein
MGGLTRIVSFSERENINETQKRHNLCIFVFSHVLKRITQLYTTLSMIFALLAFDITVKPRLI